MRKPLPLLTAALAVMAALAALALPAAAADAVQLTAAIIADGSAALLTDGSVNTYLSVPQGGSITLATEGEAIAGVYLQFDKIPAEWTCTGPLGAAACGTNHFLHEYVDVAAAIGPARTLTLTFPEGAVIAELSVWSAGELPDTVQRWEPPYEQADLLLFSTHSDDEHLFFAGILPTCIDRGLSAQVVYMTQHFDNTHNRPHEQLDGLWAVGVRHYPIVGPFPDLYATALDTARTLYASYGYQEEDFVAYAVEQLRRFKPQVVIGHDPNGEYSHGAHMVNTAALRTALELSADPTAYTASADQWGVWDVPKTYLHLWPERTVVMNWDTPLASYGGMTAFAVSRLGYDCHVSQHWTWFTRWVRGTTDAPITAAAQINSYSPCRYGLYRTTVGDDTPGVNDFFENITPYAEQRPPEPETAAPEKVEPTAAETTRPPAPATTTSPSTTSAPAVGEASGLPVSVILPIGIAIILIVAVSSVLGPVGRKKK